MALQVKKIAKMMRPDIVTWSKLFTTCSESARHFLEKRSRRGEFGQLVLVVFIANAVLQEPNCLPR